MELLERAAALDQLVSWQADARAGRGAFVLVEGEAGVGKTALLKAFAARSASTRVHLLWTSCDPYLALRPLGPLADLAAHLDGSVADLLRQTDPSRSEDPVHRDALFDSVWQRLGGGGPTVLIIEDLHWADDGTLDLLRFLARRIARTPLLVIGTYRDDEVGPDQALRLLLGDLTTIEAVRRLPLRPLSLGAVTTLAGPSGVDAERLYATTGG